MSHVMFWPHVMTGHSRGRVTRLAEVAHEIEELEQVPRHEHTAHAQPPARGAAHTQHKRQVGLNVQ